MPFVRIDLEERNSPDYAAKVSDLVHRAMVEALAIPEADHFQVVTQHPRGSGALVFDPAFLDIQRTAAIVFIQITLASGRTVDQKESLFRRIAELLHTEAGLSKQDVFVNLLEVTAQDWSFGDGEAQFARALPPHLRKDSA